jgi:hypothetical protein
MPVFAARLPIVAMAALAVAAVSVRAQEPKLLPPVTVDAPPPSPLLQTPAGNGAPPPATMIGRGGGQPAGTGNGGHERCVDVAVGNDNSFGCINERLKRKVDEVNPVLNTPPIDAKSSDLKVGTVNIPAIQQQYGSNFGRSVVPYRPATTYSPTPGHR